MFKKPSYISNMIFTFHIIFDIIIVQNKPTCFAGRWNPIREVELYSTADGDEPVADFLNSLPSKHWAKAFHEIDLLAEFGNALKEPCVKHIKGDIWELRIRFSSDISRIFYFTWQSDTIVLLHGFVKKTQKTPPREIETAQKRMDDFKHRNS